MKFDEQLRYYISIIGCSSKELAKYLLSSKYNSISLYDKSELLEIFFQNDSNFESEKEYSKRRHEEHSFINHMKEMLRKKQVYYQYIDLLVDLCKRTGNKDLAYYILDEHKLDIYTETYDELEGMLDNGDLKLLFKNS